MMQKNKKLRKKQMEVADYKSEFNYISISA